MQKPEQERTGEGAQTGCPPRPHPPALISSQGAERGPAHFHGTSFTVQCAHPSAAAGAATLHSLLQLSREDRPR